MARVISKAQVAAASNKTPGGNPIVPGKIGGTGLCAPSAPARKENAKVNAKDTTKEIIRHTTAVQPTPDTVAAERVKKVSVDIPGLRDYVRCAKMMKVIKAKLDSIMETRRPSFLAAHMRNATGVSLLADLKKTIDVTDVGTTAKLQLKASPKVLKLEDVALLTKMGIPLKLDPSREILNPKYAGGATTDAERSEAERVIFLLKQLVGANPHLNIPADLFTMTTPISKPDDDALLLLLQSDFPDAEVFAGLELVASVSVLNGEIDRTVPVPTKSQAPTEMAAELGLQPSAEIIDLATHSKGKTVAKPAKEKSPITPPVASKKQSRATR